MQFPIPCPMEVAQCGPTSPIPRYRREAVPLFIWPLCPYREMLGEGQGAPFSVCLPAGQCFCFCFLFVTKHCSVIAMKTMSVVWLSLRPGRPHHSHSETNAPTWDSPTSGPLTASDSAAAPRANPTHLVVCFIQLILLCSS